MKAGKGGEGSEIMIGSWRMTKGGAGWMETRREDKGWVEAWRQRLGWRQ